MNSIKEILKKEHFIGAHDDGIVPDCPECQDLCDHPKEAMVDIPTLTLPDRNAPPEDITLVVCRKCNKELSPIEVRERSDGHSI